jgi:hypothetical protein
MESASTTPFIDDCIEAYAKGERPPFTDATLTITLCATGSRQPDLFRAWLPNGESVSEEIMDNEKVCKLLRLFTDEESRPF